MLRITIELLPYGKEENKRQLGIAEISNVGGNLKSGDYEIKIMKWGKKRRVWRTGKVKKFPRITLGPWDLLCRALVNIVGYRNGISDNIDMTINLIKSFHNADNTKNCYGSYIFEC